MTKTIAVYALPLGYGPASKAATLVRALAARDAFEFIFLGGGVSLEFFRKEGLVGAYEQTAPLRIDEALARRLCARADAAVIVMHRAWAHRLAPHLPVFCIDSLGHLWEEGTLAAYPGITQVRRYYVQDLFGAFSTMARTGLSALRAVPPIIDTTRARPADPALVGRRVVQLGGLVNPMHPTTGEVFATHLPRLLSRLGIDAPLILTSEEACRAYASSLAGLDVRSLPRAQALAVMRDAAALWTVTGLTTMLELSALRVPFIPLPPANRSQLRNLHEIRKLLGDDPPEIWRFLDAAYAGARQAEERDGASAVSALNDRLLADQSFLDRYAALSAERASALTLLPSAMAGAADGAEEIARDMIDCLAAGQDAPARAPPDAAAARRVRMVIYSLLVVVSLAALDQGIVVTALPRIVEDVGGAGHLSWIVTGYILASTAVMPVYGRLSDQYGRKRLLYVAIGLFCVGSVLCGLARSMPELILFRVLQGLGGGGFVPLAQATIGDLVEPSRRGRRQGLYAAVTAAATVSGPMLGGGIMALLSWHWIFLINVPFCIGALLMIRRFLRPPRRARPRRLDALGALLLAAASLAFLLGLGVVPRDGWAAPQAIAVVGAAVALALGFVTREYYAPDPILPPRLFRIPAFVTSCIVVGFTSLALAGPMVFLPLYFQLGLAASPARSGLYVAALTLGIVIASYAAGQLRFRSGRYKSAQMSGLLIVLLAFLALTAEIGSGQGLTVIEPSLLVAGLGFGFVLANVTIAAQNAAPYEDLGSATATLAYFRSMGAAIGVAGSSAALFVRLGGAPGPGLGGDGLDHMAARLGAPAMGEALRQAVRVIFQLDVSAMCFALAAALFLPELPLRSGASDVARKPDPATRPPADSGPRARPPDEGVRLASRDDRRDAAATRPRRTDRARRSL